MTFFDKKMLRAQFSTQLEVELIQELQNAKEISSEIHIQQQQNGQENIFKLPCKLFPLQSND